MGQFSKRWEELNFSDNFIFCKVMKNQELCIELLEILLKIKIEKINYINTEQTIENFYDSKGIRMDVFLKDSNRVFDIEMQTGNYEDLILRARYYQSSADISTVPKRTKYKDLREIFIVFICKEDPFGLGFPRYTRKVAFEETASFPFNDKIHEVFYNSSAYNKEKDQQTRDVLKFIYNLKADSDFTRKLETAVNSTKIKAVMRSEYMYFQDILEEEKEQAREAGHSEGFNQGLAEGKAAGLAEGKAAGLEEGLAQGLEEGKAAGLAKGLAQGIEEGLEKGRIELLSQTVKNMIMKNFSIIEIAELTNSTEEEIKTICESLQN